MLDLLDDSAIRRWSAAASDAIATHEAEINELNVFPVPDGDTGTNLLLTIRAASEALTHAGPDGAAGALQAMSRGAVLGARGNSGVIVAQILRGLADSVHDTCGTEACDGPALQAALAHATERAYAAVAEPVEGTILSVVRAAAVAARAVANNPARLNEVVRAAVEGAGTALARTTEQLPALTRAGVIDAGGRGLVVLLDALAGIVTGELRPATATTATTTTTTAKRPAPPARNDPATFGYEIQYLLDADRADLDRLRAELTAVGDSVTTVGTGDGVWNVHVHSDDVGAAIEAGIRAGRPHRISVVRFADQHVQHDQAAQPDQADQPDQPGRPGRPGRPTRTERTGVAVVAVAPGRGLAHLFAGEGVVVVGGGPTDNPSTAEVLAAVLATGAAQVILLPNASQVTGVAESAATEARVEGIEVVVVPTRSPVQGLAAVAVHDPRRRFGDDVVAMAEAAAATRWAEITIAERDALTSAGRCAAGDVLGLIGGEVVEIGTSVSAVAQLIIDRLIGVGGELITILVGQQVDSAVGPGLADYVAAVSPGVEVSVFEGGQPDFPLLIGVE